jgi:hypothetical protein
VAKAIFILTVRSGRRSAILSILSTSAGGDVRRSIRQRIDQQANDAERDRHVGEVADEQPDVADPYHQESKAAP